MKNLDISGLNREQKEAVKTIKGPLLVLAGAGSGKTRVITYRIAYMIKNGISPKNILAVTFTNKAAAEMKERLEAIIGEGRVKELTVSTFHAFGVKVLRESGYHIGIPRGFVIYTPSDLERMVKNIFKEELRIDIADKKMIRGVLQIISEAKTSFITPEKLEKEANSENLLLASKVYKLYNKHLRVFGAVDFDDLIIKTIELLETKPKVLSYYQNRFKYILIDEYQDTNDAQFRLIDLLSKTNKNICVVGDDDQSIYGFRGANVKNILQFTTQFPNSKEIKLEQNYRSTENILKAANGVIKQNSARKSKRLWSSLGKGDKILLYLVDDPDMEAEKISIKINSLIRDGINYKDIALIYRSNYQSKPFETAFRDRNIPFKVVGSTAFFERKEIKDLISYLTITVFPQAEIHFRRVINYPPRNIGTKSIQKLTQYGSDKNIPFSKLLKNADNILNSKKTLSNIKNFLAMVEKYGNKFKDNIDFETVLNYVQETNLITQIYSENKTGVVADQKKRNIIFLIESIEKYCKKYNSSLKDYLLKFALEPDSAKKEDKKDEITLLSIHASKGLEFPYVFLVDFNENVIPHQRSLETGIKGDLEEERRLCYVAITRAKKQLILSAIDNRKLNGKLVDYDISRFLSEIPENVLKLIDFRAGDSDISDKELTDSSIDDLDKLFGL